MSPVSGADGLSGADGVSRVKAVSGPDVASAAEPGGSVVAGVSTARAPGTPHRTAPALQHRVARVLTAGTAIGVALLAVGVVLMAIAGRAPIPGSGVATSSRFELSVLVEQIAGGQPEGFIWLGLAVLIATPAARVAASLVGFAAGRERAMVAVAAAILVVIAAGVVVGALTG